MEGRDPGPDEARCLDLADVLCLETPQALDHLVAHPHPFVEVSKPATP